MSTMTIHGHTVRIDGKTVATLSYSGRLVTVTQVLEGDNPGPVAGRLFRQSDGQDASYDAWTALHPASVTPSDRLLGENLPMAGAIAMVLDHAKAAL